MRVTVIDVRPWPALHADESREEDFRQWLKTSQANVVERHVGTKQRYAVTSLPHPFTEAGDVRISLGLRFPTDATSTS